MRVPLIRLLLASSIAAGALAPTASAERVAPPPGQTEPRVSPIVAYFDGVTAWSEFENASDGSSRYALTVFANGHRARVPIAPRTVPFDVDLGPDGHGNIVAVYSRCRTEPGSPRSAIDAGIYTTPYPPYTTGRGCDLYRFDFATGRESKLVGASTDRASEVLPSIWKDQIAFARVYERRSGVRGIYPYLYTRPVAGGRSKRQPGGARGETGLPGPTSIDLYGDRLSFVWNHTIDRSEGRGGTAVRMDTIGGRHRVIDKDDFRLSRGDYATFLNPSGARGRIYYGYQRIRGLVGAGARPASSTKSVLRRQRISTREITSADAPPFLVSTAVDNGVIVLGHSTDGEQYLTPLGEVLRERTPTFRR